MSEYITIGDCASILQGRNLDKKSAEEVVKKLAEYGMKLKE